MKRVIAKRARRHRATSCAKCRGSGQWWWCGPPLIDDDLPVHHICKCPGGDKFRRPIATHASGAKDE